LTTQTDCSGLTCRSPAMAGSAMLAIAVSSEAIASAVKIAAMAQRRCAAGRPSATGGAGSRAAAGNVIVIALACGSGGVAEEFGVYYGRDGFHRHMLACCVCAKAG
jgi:hypothetical protein